MKIRNGFVSNSSSSSFLIWGICVDSGVFGDAGAFVEESDPEEDEEYNTNDIYSFVEQNSDLVQTAYDSSDLYCGRCPSECRDDETMGDFKNRVETEVRALFDKHKVEGANLKFCWLSEAWHD